MIRELRLGNFKAFGPTQTIPVRPITLLYGPNSAGKSSVIHALALLHEAATGAQPRDLDVKTTSIGGRSIDLGGFRQYVHRRDPSRRLEIGFLLNARDLANNSGLRAVLGDDAVELSLSYGETVDDQGQPVRDSRVALQSFELATNGQPFLRGSRRPPRSRNDLSAVMRIDLLDYRCRIIDAFLRATIETFTTLTTVQEADLAIVQNAAAALVPNLRGRSAGFLPGLSLETEHGLEPAWSPRTMHPVSRSNREGDLEEAIRLLLPGRLNDLLYDLNGAIEQQLKPLEYLGPIRTYPPRHLAFSEPRGDDAKASGESAWYEVLNNDVLRDKVNRWLGAEFMQTPYSLAIRSYTSDEDLHRFLSRVTMKLHVVDETDEDGNPVPEDLDFETAYQQLGKQVTEFESMLYDGLVMNGVQTGQTAGNPIRELVLLDKRTQTAVSHRDVGIGVSQVLPVLVQAMTCQGALLAIEQPEIHLHPALQAELADVFIEHAVFDESEDPPCSFLLETHSEHLLLRILRRIRETTEGTLPDDKSPIRPEHVAVLYVEPGNDGSRVIEIPITEDGEFSRPWPKGFFAERLREMM